MLQYIVVFACGTLNTAVARRMSHVILCVASRKLNARACCVLSLHVAYFVVAAVTLNAARCTSRA